MIGKSASRPSMRRRSTVKVHWRRIGECGKVRAVARRPEIEPILSRDELAEFTRRLSMLSAPGVESTYQTAYAVSLSRRPYLLRFARCRKSENCFPAHHPPALPSELNGGLCSTPASRALADSRAHPTVQLLPSCL